MRWIRRHPFVTSLLMLALLAVATWVLIRPPGLPPATAPLPLPDGSSVSVMTTTYGTRHRIGPWLAHLVDRLPGRARVWAFQWLGNSAALRFSADTSEPMLLVWVLRNPITNSAALPRHAYTVQLADAQGALAGQTVNYVGYPLEHLQFSLFPRRDRELRLRFFERGSSPKTQDCGTLTVPNPFYAAYPEWTPEALPARRETKEFVATLSQVTTGHGMGLTHTALADGSTRVTRAPGRPGEVNYTWVKLDVRSAPPTNTQWQVAGVEITDATGNRCEDTMISWDNAAAGFAFYPALWPGETYRLKLQLRRNNHLPAEELMTFRSVPLGNLDQKTPIHQTQTAKGVTLALEHVLRRAPNTNDAWSGNQLSQVTFTNAPLPAGLHLEFLEGTFDTGETAEAATSTRTETERTYCFKAVPTTARTADFRFAVQPLRTVEFTVRPQAAK